MKGSGQGVSEVADYTPALARVRELRSTPSSYPIKDAGLGRQLRKRIAVARAKLTLPFLQTGAADKSDAREYSRLCTLVCLGWLVLIAAMVLSHLDAFRQFSSQNSYHYQLPFHLKVLPDSVAYEYAERSIYEDRNGIWSPIELNPVSQGIPANSSKYFMRLHASKGYCQFGDPENRSKQKITVIVRLKGNQIICDVYENK
jgi:hypothetical protein